MTQNQFPKGWNEDRVCQVINYYENQTEDEAMLEDETILENQTVMQVPTELVPTILELIKQYHSPSSVS